MIKSSTNPILRFARWFKFKVFPHDIYESLRPMIWIFLLLGVLPLRISGSRGNYRLKQVYLGYLTAFIMLLIMIFSYLVTISLESIFLTYFMAHPFSNVVDRVLITSSLLGTIMIYFKNIRRSYGFVRIVQRLADVDDRLKAIGGRMRHGHTTFDILLRLTSGTTLFSVYVSGSYHLLSVQGRRTHLTTWVAYFVPHMLLMMVLFQHRTVMHLLVNRFAEMARVSKSAGQGQCRFLRCHYP